MVPLTVSCDIFFIPIFGWGNLCVLNGWPWWFCRQVIIYGSDEPAMVLTLLWLVKCYVGFRAAAHRSIQHMLHDWPWWFRGLPTVMMTWLWPMECFVGLKAVVHGLIQHVLHCRPAPGWMGSHRQGIIWSSVCVEPLIIQTQCDHVGGIGAWEAANDRSHKLSHLKPDTQWQPQLAWPWYQIRSMRCLNQGRVSWRSL